MNIASLPPHNQNNGRQIGQQFGQVVAQVGLGALNNPVPKEDPKLPPPVKLPAGSDDRSLLVRADDKVIEMDRAALATINSKGLISYIQSEIKDGKLSDGAKRVIAKYLSDNHSVDAVKRNRDGIEINPDSSVRSFRDVIQDAINSAESAGSHRVQAELHEPNSRADRIVFTDAEQNRIILVLHTDIAMLPDAKDPSKSRMTNFHEFSQFSVKYQTAEQFKNGEQTKVLLEIDRGNRP